MKKFLEKSRWCMMLACLLLMLCSGTALASEDDNSLSSLGILTEGAVVSPEFSYNTWSYEVRVPAGTKELSLDPVPSSASATISSINGTTLKEDGTGYVTITVAAGNGSPFTYELNVVSDASLAGSAQETETETDTTLKEDGTGYVTITVAAGNGSPFTYELNVVSDASLAGSAQETETETETEAETETETETETEDSRYVKVDKNTIQEAENTITDLKGEITKYKDKLGLLETETETETETEDSRYVKVDKNTIQEAENTITDLKGEITKYKDKLGLFTKIMYGLIGLAVILLFVVINLLLRKKDLKAELNDYRSYGYTDSKVAVKAQKKAEKMQAKAEQMRPGQNGMPKNGVTQNPSQFSHQNDPNQSRPSVKPAAMQNGAAQQQAGLDVQPQKSHKKPKQMPQYQDEQPRQGQPASQSQQNGAGQPVSQGQRNGAGQPVSQGQQRGAGQPASQEQKAGRQSRKQEKSGKKSRSNDVEINMIDL